MADQQEVLNRIEAAAQAFLAAKPGTKKQELAHELRRAANRLHAVERVAAGSPESLAVLTSLSALRALGLLDDHTRREIPTVASLAAALPASTQARSMSSSLVEPTSIVMDTWYRTGLASLCDLSSHFMR